MPWAAAPNSASVTASTAGSGFPTGADSGKSRRVFRDAMKEDLEELGYEAPGALWGQYEHRKRPKKKPKPVTTSRQGNKNGGANGRNGETQQDTETASRNGQPN